jgi:hypothetical protein
MREIKCDQNAPATRGLPLLKFRSYSKHFGKPSFSKEYRSGTIYYKQGYDFLEEPSEWSVVKPDVSISPRTILYQYENQLFMERGYFNRTVNYKGMNQNHLDILVDLSTINFPYAKFENIVGLFKGDRDDECLLYHTYTCDTTLDGIDVKLSKKELSTVLKILAQSLRELNDIGIHYSECQPTNIRYNDKMLIFAPHNCIEVDDLNERVNDITAVLYTNDWIQDRARFCKHYLGNEAKDVEKYKRFKKVIEEGMKWLEIGDTCQMDKWLRRGIVDLPKEYRYSL